MWVGWSNGEEDVSNTCEFYLKQGDITQVYIRRRKSMQVTQVLYQIKRTLQKHKSVYNPELNL